jgi:uncharacterized membrane protein YfcA
VELLLIYLVLGAFAGLVAGLLGVGGGLVIVPALALVFQQQGVAEGVIMHLAIGTSLATIVVTSVSSTQAHRKRGAVRWDAFIALAPWLVVGALAGAAVADMTPSRWLRTIFGLFELAVAVQIGLNLMTSPHRRLPGTHGMLGAGTVIGFVSAILGIGGGTLTVPFLVWCNVAIRQAVATSAAAGLPIALAGAAGFAANGWDKLGLPPWSTGYLYWPAFAAIAATSLLAAPLGARLAHTLPTGVLRRIFAVFLAILGIRMLLG